ncbi:MAG: adenylosuccinate synthetase [Comamonadaceae bacterium]|nr:adenylosuccinate synthetase [Comamonadaceae bacterium]
MARRALRVQDLKHPARFEAKLRDAGRPAQRRTRRRACGAAAARRAADARRRRCARPSSSRPMMADVGYRLHQRPSRRAPTCCSKARRARCWTSTTAPTRTSRRATAWPATPPPARASGPGMLHYILGITKAYTTRVGGGPFPTELDDRRRRAPSATTCRTVGQERGTVTGRARRCGWLDAAALKRSIIINGVSGLCITKLDVLDGLPEIKICTGYQLDGRARRRAAAGRRRDRRLPADLRDAAGLDRHAPPA